MCFLSSCPHSSVLTLMMPDTGPQRTMSSLPNSSGLPCPRSPAAHSSPRNPVPCNVKCGTLKEEHRLNNYGGNSLSLPVTVNYISISRGEKCDYSPPPPGWLPWRKANDSCNRANFPTSRSRLRDMLRGLPRPLDYSRLMETTCQELLQSCRTPLSRWTKGDTHSRDSLEMTSINE